MSFDALLDMFNESEASEGLTGGDVLPKGKYPVEVAQVLDIGVSEAKGTPYVRAQLRVLDGPYEGRNAFVTIWLSRVGTDVQEVVKRYNADRERNPNAFKALSKDEQKIVRFWNGSVGLLRALGVQPNAHPAPDGNPDAEFWAAPSWVGRQFIAGIGIETAESQAKAAEKRGVSLDDPRDRNRLQSWHHLDADTLADWRQKELPKQAAAATKGSTTVTGTDTNTYSV